MRLAYKLALVATAAFLTGIPIYIVVSASPPPAEETRAVHMIVQTELEFTIPKSWSNERASKEVEDKIMAAFKAAFPEATDNTVNVISRLPPPEK